MEAFLMFWALVNLAVSLANAVNLRRLKIAQAKADALLESMEEGEADT